MRYLFALLFLVGCGHRIHSGTVVEKEYEPGRYYTYYTTMICGKTTLLVPHTAYDDEDFTIRVTGVDGQDTITEWFYLTKDTWDQIRVGNCFNDSVDCWREDRKH